MKPQATIENPILNSPFVEPGRHLRFDEHGITNQIVVERRPSSYFIPIAQPKKKSKDQQQAFEGWTEDRIEENKTVNAIRPRVQAWREGGYPDVTRTTARLLEHRSAITERRTPNQDLRNRSFCGPTLDLQRDTCNAPQCGHLEAALLCPSFCAHSNGSRCSTFSTPRDLRRSRHTPKSGLPVTHLHECHSICYTGRPGKRIAHLCDPPVAGTNACPRRCRTLSAKVDSART